MVAAKLWLSDLNLIFRSDATKKKRAGSNPDNSTLGILAFEAARTIAHLVSVYHSISPAQILILQKVVFKTDGIRFFNSFDETHLFKLAFAEKLDDVDRAAAAIARLGAKCSTNYLRSFDRVYTDLKMGLLDLSKLWLNNKELNQKIAKLEKLVTATSDLFSSLELLSQLEAAERKLNRNSYSGPIPLPKLDTDTESLEQKLWLQRQHVQRMREESLWSQPFDKMVSIMARIACNVFARVCITFGPHVVDLPNVFLGGGESGSGASRKLQIYSYRSPLICQSGPLERSVSKVATPRFSGPLSQKTETGFPILMFRKSEASRGLESRRWDVSMRQRLMELASPTTVGDAGLARRYADVIIQAEKLLQSVGSIEKDTRDNLYQMLPAALRKSIEMKIRKWLECDQLWGLDDSIAQGWIEALGRILGWLAPMAHAMIRWQMERSLEQQLFEARPTMLLLLQTLYFSDREKTEAAIVEVLVGLSCISLYKIRKATSADRETALNP